MPALVRYMVARMGIGFSLGATSALLGLQFNPIVFGGELQILEVFLVVYGMGSAFALGYLATALAVEQTEQ